MISVSLMLYFTLAVGSADIKGNLSDSEVVYRTTGSPGRRLNMILACQEKCHYCYVFTLAVGSADIKGNLSDSEVVYRTTGSPRT